MQVIDWQRVVNKYGQIVWENAYRLLGNRTDAANCFAQAFISGLEISQRKYIRNAYTLLLRLVTAGAIHQLRQHYHQTKHREEAVDLVFVPSNTSGSTQQVQAQDMVGKLRKALGQLPPLEAEVFCLHHLNNLGYRQIGYELGVKSNTVSVLLHRATLKLNDILEIDLDENESSSAATNKNNLNDFISAVKKAIAPDGPSSAEIDTVLAKLSRITDGEMKTANKPITFAERFAAIGGIVKITTAVIVIALITGVTVYISQKDDTTPGKAVKFEIENVFEKTTDKQRQAKIDIELKKLERVFIARDINGLLAMLNTGHPETKIAAANYLSVIGDIRAIAALDRLSHQYQGADNPFAAAIEKINARLETSPIKKPREPESTLKEQAVENIFHGWLIDVNDNPVVGEIQLGDAKILTDEQGKFVISKLLHDEPGIILGQAFNKEHTMGSFFIWDEANDINNIEIVVGSLASITGFVTDRQNNPINDYKLQLSIYVAGDLLYEGGINESLLEIQTYPDGSFDINSIPTGLSFDLVIDKPGYKTTIKLEDLAANKVLDIGQVILEPLEETAQECTLKGFIINEVNEPISGATLSATAGDEHFEIQSDEDGRFEIGLPTHIRLQMTVYVKGYGNNLFVLECINSISERDIQIFPPAYDWLGKEAPGLFIKRWLNTEPLTLEQLGGQVILLSINDYLSKGNSVSRLLQLNEKYADEPFTIIAIHSSFSTSSEVEGDLERFIKENVIDFPFGLDAAADIIERALLPRDRVWDDNLIRVGRMGIVSEGAMYSLYEAREMPAYYLIDKTGILRATPTETEDSLEEWIELLLNE